MSDSKTKYKIENISKKDLIVYHHLGLGDHIVMNGLINYISKSFERIYLPAKSKYFKQIEYMYEHNNKVEVFKVDDLNEYRDITSFSDTNNLEILKVGFEKIKTLEKFFEGFYNQLDLSFKVSYDYFKITDNHEKNVLLTNHLKNYYNSDEKYVLLHLESSQGSFSPKILEINTKYSQILIEKNSDIFGNIFLYQDLIRNAEEIHCLHSSIFHLVDRVPTNAKLFFHNLKQEKNIQQEITIDKKWKYIDYH